MGCVYTVFDIENFRDIFNIKMIFILTVCPTGFDLWETKCHLFKNTGPISQEDAKSMCESEGGRLIVILSEEEGTHLLNTYQTTAFWMGCMDNNPHEGFWACEGYDHQMLHFDVDGTKAGYWSEYSLPRKQTLLVLDLSCSLIES